MEVLIVSVSLINLIVNLFILRKLSGTKLSSSIQYYVEPISSNSGSVELESVQYYVDELRSTEPDSVEPVLEEPIVAEELVAAKAPIADDRYNAWRNVKEETVKTVLPIYHQRPLPISGPLERPGGFV